MKVAINASTNISLRKIKVSYPLRKNTYKTYTEYKIFVTYLKTSYNIK